MAEEERVRRLGIVPAPFAGESFVSWVDAVAVALRVSRVAALQALGLSGTASFSLHQFHLDTEELEGIWLRTGLRSAQVERMLFSYYGQTALPQFAPGTARGRLLAGNPWLRRDHSAACPLCLKASGSRWLLSWRLKWTFLCADHWTYLVDRCPRCGRRLYWRIESAGTEQRTHCTRSVGRSDRRRLGAQVCGFPVGEILAPPVEDEEAIHVQRRVSALLTPADSPHNETSRRLLQQLSRGAHDASLRKTAAGLLDRMEDAVIRAVYEAQQHTGQSPLAFALEHGSPAAVSSLIRIAARAVLSDNSPSGSLC